MQQLQLEDLWQHWLEEVADVLVKSDKHRSILAVNISRAGVIDSWNIYNRISGVKGVMDGMRDPSQVI